MNRLEHHAPLIAAAIVLAVGLSTMTTAMVGVFFDDAVYVLVAKAIAAGDGFIYPMLPGTPAAIHYPPLFPLLLSLVWKISPEFPGNVVWFKMVNPILLAGAAFAAVVAAERIFGMRRLLALLLVLAAMVSVPVHVLATVVLSEPLFLALLFPALLAARTAVTTGTTRDLLIAAVLAAALVLTRTIGGVLCIATVLMLVAERRWRGIALYGAAVALLLLPWQLFVWKHAPGFADELRGSYGPYLEWLVAGYREGGVALVLAVAAENLGDAWLSVGTMVFPFQILWARQLLTLLAWGVLAWGLWVSFAHGASRLAALALAGYLALVVIWPYQVERFVWGVWPFMLMVAYAGARDLWTRARRAAPGLSPRALSLAVAGLAALLVAGHSIYNVRGLSRGWASSASRSMSERLLPLVQYVNSDPRLAGKVIATEASPIVGLYTGSTVVPVEILAVRDHLGPKPMEERASIIGRIDRRFRPDAYVVLPRGPYLGALVNASFDPGRRFLEITPVDVQVRSFLLSPP